jgi:hypothetical protein
MSQHNRKGDRRQGGPAGWHAFYSAQVKRLTSISPSTSFCKDALYCSSAQSDGLRFTRFCFSVTVVLLGLHFITPFTRL